MKRDDFVYTIDRDKDREKLAYGTKQIIFALAYIFCFFLIFRGGTNAKWIGVILFILTTCLWLFRKERRK